MMGCSPGWGCEAVINHQNKAFDLEKPLKSATVTMRR